MKDGAYRRENAFWKARSLAELAAEAPERERTALTARMDALAKIYAELSAAYQAQKGRADIPLS